MLKTILSMNRNCWLVLLRRLGSSTVPVFFHLCAATGVAQSVMASESFFASSLAACPSDQEKYWDNCFGTYFQRDGDQYIGEWSANKINGPGLMVRANGERYVGGFLNGEFSGVGVEYSSVGSVKNAGVWHQGRLVKTEQVDLSLFPLKLRGSLRAFQASQKSAASQLEIARSEIRALKERNAELERQLRSKSVGPVSSVTNLVQACVARGFQPGSRDFSRCIANEN